MRCLFQDIGSSSAGRGGEGVVHVCVCVVLDGLGVENIHAPPSCSDRTLTRSLNVENFLQAVLVKLIYVNKNLRFSQPKRIFEGDLEIASLSISCCKQLYDFRALRGKMCSERQQHS